MLKCVECDAVLCVVMLNVSVEYGVWLCWIVLNVMQYCVNGGKLVSKNPRATVAAIYLYKCCHCCRISCQCCQCCQPDILTSARNKTDCSSAHHHQRCFILSNWNPRFFNGVKDTKLKLTLYCRWVDISTRLLRIREAIKKKIYNQNVRTHLSSDY